MAGMIEFEPAATVQVYTSELEIDPILYVVEKQDKALVTLKVVCATCNGKGKLNEEPCTTCKETGVSSRRQVHHTRIARILDSSGKTVFESPVLRKEKRMVNTAKTAESVDFATLKSQGELYSKSVNFDHTEFRVEAHVLIEKDHSAFRVFNSYNGSLGKKGKTGKSYPLADEAAYENKVSQLTKQGYKLNK